MTYVSGNYENIENGALYRYTWDTTADDAGPHTYYFEAQDIQATTRLPASGTYSGPTLWLRWRDASAGTGTSVGLTEDDSLWYWGGLGGDVYTRPVKLRGINWRDISAGWGEWTAIRSNGTLWKWTPSISYQPDAYDGGPWYDWTDVSIGSSHLLGIRSDGTLWSWGSYNIPQLGQGENALGTVARVGTASDWVEISAGGDYSLGIRSDGSLWGWGNNLGYTLGFDSGENQYIWFPTRVGSGNNWAAVSAGSSHSLGLRSDGTLWGWGSNGASTLGLGADVWGSVTPTQIGTDSDWVAIAAGSYHSLALKSNGTLWGWGLNSWGEVGTGSTDRQRTPVQVGDNNTWRKISAGDGYSLGVRADGSLWAWGSNSAGQLGLGDTTDRTTPVQVGAVW